MIYFFASFLFEIRLGLDVDTTQIALTRNVFLFLFVFHLSDPTRI